ncbi:MAG: TMEM175 family protein [Spirosomataceae bacterium]
MDHLEHELKKEFQLERLILFSDAVFAIAITLLVIEIKVPELHGDELSESNLLQGMAHLIPKFIGFLISFIFIGLFWTIHHRMFGFVSDYNPKLLWLNLFFLLSIVLMPFSSGLYGEYSTPKTMHLLTPIAVYAFNICYSSLMLYFLWGYIGNPANKLTESPLDKTFVRLAQWRSLTVAIVFLMVLVFAIVINPIVARYMPILTAPILRLVAKVASKKQAKKAKGK